MTDAGGHWAAKLREIARAVKAWEDRDVQEQEARGDARLHRPAYFIDLEELAGALEGTSARFTARIKARQNWPRTVADFDRDWAIAALVHEHRLDSNSTVAAGKAEACKLPASTEAIVDEADKRFRRYFIDGSAEFVRPFLRLQAGRIPTKIGKGGGKI